ncbi:hypothetical protein FSP39_012903 [Pinctada imbricata]|uniref:PLAT domain-containing protein n=1 Tax=Pinctada imbricata TaxID=66713 RepID=A0AA88XQV1_PINIB|nr:hypothetical protein FSP39_012903 [Pinctada imbricata]
MKYQVIVYTGDVHSAGTDANVYVALFGTKGSTGRRLLKHSLTNNSKFEQDQVDQFEVEAVDLGKVTKVVIGHDSSGSGSGWFLKKVVITESPESIQKFVFPCDKWLDEGEDDNKIERTLILDESVSDLSAPELQTQASKLPPTAETGIRTPTPEPKAKTPEPKVKTPTPEPKAKTPSPEPKTKTPTPEPKAKTPTPEPKAKTPTPEPKVKTPSPEPKVKTPSPEPKAKTPTPEPDVKAPTPEPDVKAPTPEPDVKTPTPEAVVEAPTQESESVEQNQEQNEEAGKELDTARTDSPKDKTPLPPSPKDGDYKVYVIASNQEDGRGSEAQLVLTVYGDLGNSGPISLGEPNKGFFKAGFTDLFDIHVDKEELGEIRKIRLEVENTHPNASVMLDKVEMEDKVKEQKFIFNVNRPLSLEEGDLAIEIPVDDRTHEVWPVRRYEVQTYTSTDPDAGTDALAHIVLVGTLGDSGRRYLVKNRDGGKKFQPGAVDSFIVEAVDLGRLETIIIGHNGKGAESGWSLDKVAIKESVDAKEKYLFPCGSRLQDDDDYGIVEVELYMDRVEREKSDVENTNNNAQEENADNEDTNTEGQLTERSKEEQDKIDDKDDDKGDDNQQTIKEDDKDDTKTDKVDDDKQSVKGEDLVVNGNSVKGETYRKDGRQPNTEETKTEDKTEKEG